MLIFLLKEGCPYHCLGGGGMQELINCPPMKLVVVMFSCHWNARVFTPIFTQPVSHWKEYLYMHTEQIFVYIILSQSCI